MGTFQDIRINGMDDNASGRVDPDKALYKIVLTLSASAPDEWAEYFNSRWEQHQYMMKSNASVFAEDLTIYCVPDELERHHLPELKQVIEETNRKYRQLLLAQDVYEMKKAEVQTAEKEMLNHLKNTIDFE